MDDTHIGFVKHLQFVTVYMYYTYVYMAGVIGQRYNVSRVHSEI